MDAKCTFVHARFGSYTCEYMRGISRDTLAVASGDEITGLLTCSGDDAAAGNGAVTICS